MLKFDHKLLELMTEQMGLTVHGWVGTASVIKNLWFTNPLFGQCRFFGDDKTKHAPFVPDKFLHKKKSDKRNYKAIIDKPKIHSREVILYDTTILIMEPSDTFGLIEHYFHFCEHLISVWNAYKIWEEHSPSKPVKRIILLSYEIPRWNWEGPNSINRHLLRALFPEAQILTFDHLKQMGKRKILRFERVISSDRAVANRAGENKMLKASLPYISKRYIQEMSTKVHEALGTQEENKIGRRLLLARRTGERSINPKLLHHLANMARLQGYELQSVDFSRYSYPQQLQFIRNADVFMGVHGNGLTHSLFLPPHAKSIEIFPPGSHLVEYRMLCEAAGIRYHGIDPYKGEYSKKQSEKLGEVIGEHAAINDLPMDLIRRLL